MLIYNKLFYPGWKNLFYFGPIIFLILTFLDLTVLNLTHPLFSKDKEELLLNIFFLNSLHLVFPFILIGVFPEGRSLVQIKIKNYLFMTKAILGLAIIFLLSYFNSPFVSGIEKKGYVEPLMFWVWILWPIYHGVRQSTGFCLIYNKIGLKQPVKKKQSTLSIINLERLTYFLFSITVLFSLVSSNTNFLSSNYPKILWVGPVLSVGILIFVYRINSAIPNLSFEKHLFSLRLFLWALTPFSPFAYWGAIFCHGTEYSFFYAKLYGKVGEAKVKRKILWVTVVAMGVLLTLSCLQYFAPFLNQITSGSTLFILSVYVFYPFFTMAHYMLDGVLYRFSDKEIKAVVEPWILFSEGEKAEC